MAMSTREGSFRFACFFMSLKYEDKIIKVKYLGT